MSDSVRWGYPRTAPLAVENGVVIAYSDAHYWPAVGPTIAFRALLALAGALNPRAIIANGDLIDGFKISRHARIAWSHGPCVAEEIAEAQARQSEIRAAAPRARRFRTIGNHDIRYDNFLAEHAPDFEGVPGTRLSHHLPDWPESWSVRINEGGAGDTIIKHRWKGGIHAAWNNVVKSAVNIGTGHTHRAEARSCRGYEPRRRWGFETGTLSEHPQDSDPEGNGPFEYAEDAPSDAGSGFAVLTYHKGALLPPEFCSIEDGTPYFRGQRVLCGATRRNPKPK